MHYTPAQTKWFLRAIVEHEAAERMHAVVDARVAQAMGSEVVQRHMTELAKAATTT